jgi:hypothetical protein
MTTTSKDCKNQHYVPQFLLRHFTTAKKKHIYVYDKFHERSFKTAVRNVGAENAFYDCEHKGEKISIDSKLEIIETLAAPIIKRIIKNESLGSLKNKDKSIISLFCAIQMLRVKATRESISELNNTLKEFIEQIGGNIDEVEGFKFMDKYEIKKSSIGSVLTAGELAPYFYDKIWLLLKTPSKAPLYISDNPISLFNSVRRPGRGSLGLKVKGIEIQLPVSNNLCLSMVCPSLIEEIDHGAKKAQLLERALGLEYTGFLHDAHNILNAVFTGSARQLKPENVEHLNSLQVGSASRFIYSSTSDFSLVQDMIKNEPSLKEPRRFNGNQITNRDSDYKKDK